MITLWISPHDEGIIKVTSTGRNVEDSLGHHTNLLNKIKEYARQLLF